MPRPLDTARWAFTALPITAMFAASALSLYSGVVDDGAPPAIGALFPLAIDGGAAASALGALDNARKGEGPGVFRAIMWTLIAVSMVVNGAHAYEHWGGWVLGAALAALPLLAAGLVDANIRAILRTELRAAGVIPPPLPRSVTIPAARFPARRWAAGPWSTFRAWRTAQLEFVSDPLVALARSRGEAVELPPPPPRPVLDPARDPGPMVEQPADPDPRRGRPLPPQPDRPTARDVVRDAVAAGATRDEVRAAVLEAFPDAKPDTISRYIRLEEQQQEER